MEKLIELMLRFSIEFNLKLLSDLIEKYKDDKYKDDKAILNILKLQCIVVYYQLSNVKFDDIKKGYDEYSKANEFYNKLKS